jgi:ribosomal protein L37AE/L43A
MNEQYKMSGYNLDWERPNCKRCKVGTLKHSIARGVYYCYSCQIYYNHEGKFYSLNIDEENTFYWYIEKNKCKILSNGELFYLNFIPLETSIERIKKIIVLL